MMMDGGWRVEEDCLLDSMRSVDILLTRTEISPTSPFSHPLSAFPLQLRPLVDCR